MSSSDFEVLFEFGQRLVDQVGDFLRGAVFAVAGFDAEMETDGRGGVHFVSGEKATSILRAKKGGKWGHPESLRLEGSALNFGLLEWPGEGEGRSQKSVAAECSALADEYVRAGIIPARFKNDALHVAVAVWHKLEVVVSWNMAHLVNVRKVERINVVNERSGLPRIRIHTPEEVLDL